VSWKEKKELSRDLKGVYGASTLNEAEAGMERFEEKWRGKYPHVIKSWRANWERLRKVTDGRRLFPSVE